jgi:transposase
MQKKQYDKEFKIQTVQMIREQGKSVAQVARELGINKNTLHRWMDEYALDRNQAFPGSGHQRPEDQAFRELQKRIRDLEEENAILKKAMHIFAKDRK